MNFRVFNLFFSILVWSVLSLANSSVENLNVSLIQKSISFKPGKVETLKLHLSLPNNLIKEKAHVYSDQFKIRNINPETFVAGEIKVENEIDFYDKFTKKNRKGFNQDSILSIQFEAPANFKNDIKEISFEIRYQVCTEKVCFLPQYKKITSPVGLSPDEISTKDSESNPFSLFSVFSFEDISGNIYLSILVAFIAGILTSFTPCIFPMIPITISVLGYDAEKNSRRENFFRTLLYVLGIAMTYSSLGVVAALTGQLFGSLLSNTYILVGLSILFFTMALGMLGLFELQVPAAIRNRFGVGRTEQNYMNLFIMGLIAGVVASPCVGPVLVSILSYVSTTRDVFLGFILLFSYALGLGLLFMLIGLFGQLVSYLPRSGKWMNKIKYVLGVMMIAMSLYYLNLAFPEIKTTLFKTQKQEAQGNWIPYSEDKVKEAKALNKPVMIDFRADWCAACIELEKHTFSRPEFISLSEGFVLLKLDATEESDAINAILKKYDVKGLPTVLFLNKKGQIDKNLSFTQFIEWKKLEPKMLEAMKD